MERALKVKWCCFERLGVKCLRKRAEDDHIDCGKKRMIGSS